MPTPRAPRTTARSADLDAAGLERDHEPEDQQRVVADAADRVLEAPVHGCAEQPRSDEVTTSRGGHA